MFEKIQYFLYKLIKNIFINKKYQIIKISLKKEISNYKNILL